ncbi:hypothetical protein HYY69_03260 [Candidatus Woesearchaeota archaeon]|nr:hypothetical protein [Candidatus Woesearchaeota archaeon]
MTTLKTTTGKLVDKELLMRKINRNYLMVYILVPCGLISMYFGITTTNESLSLALGGIAGAVLLSGAFLEIATKIIEKKAIKGEKISEWLLDRI